MRDIASAGPKHKANSPAVSRATQRLACNDLARSGLALDDAGGIFAVDDASAVNPDFAPKPALIIPYFDADGAPLIYERDGAAIPFCRARYLAPPGFPLPRDRRYDQPGDSGTPPYFPPGFDWTAPARGELDAVVITEGEKKALALTRAGLPAIAIGGVFNFSDGAAPLHPALAAIMGKLRAAYIVFDSDAATKPQIQAAEWRLAGQLAIGGATPRIVRIPGDGDRKVGADDFLVEHGAEALHEIIISTPPLGTAATPNDDAITVADMLGREVYPVEELIPGWVEKGVPNFIAGPGGVHKSRLALQWGLCLNAGAAVWGIGAALDGLRASLATLVYCAAEDDANELARRAQAISRALKLPKAKQGVILPRRGKDTVLVVMGESAEVDVRPFYHELVTRLRGIPGHKIAVLDSAYDFVRFVGKAKIDEDAVNYFIKVVLQGLCDQTDSTLLIPWHPSRSGSERGEMDGWSVAWHNAARVRLALGEVKDVPDTYELRAVKRNHGPKGQPIALRFHEGALLSVDAVPDDGKAAELQQTVVKSALEAAEHGIPFNRRNAPPKRVFDEAEKALGRRPSKQQVKDALEDAVIAGALTYVTRTQYRAAGFYPPDKERAIELSHQARRAGRFKQENDDA